MSLKKAIQAGENDRREALRVEADNARRKEALARAEHERLVAYHLANMKSNELFERVRKAVAEGKSQFEIRGGAALAEAIEQIEGFRARVITHEVDLSDDMRNIPVDYVVVTWNAE